MQEAAQSLFFMSLNILDFLKQFEKVKHLLILRRMRT